VLLSTRLPARPPEPDPEDAEELDALRRRVESARAAGRLQEAGVRFAFASQGGTSAEMVTSIRRFVRAGLRPEAALRALTLGAAEILGVQNQLGSLEKGKIANLVLADGDLTAERTRIRTVFVDGKLYDVSRPPTPAGGPAPRPTREDEDHR